MATFLERRIFLGIAVIALLGLMASGATLVSQRAFAGGSNQSCNEQDANEPAGQEVDDALEVECEDAVAAGTIDDGKELLPQASITLDEAIAAASAAASGSLGEIDLEYYNGTLVFNVDIGDNDVKVDAATGAVLGMGKD